MTETGHWIRLSNRIDELQSREALNQEQRELKGVRKHYRDRVTTYVVNGGSINHDHDWLFEFIVRQSLTEIQDEIEILDILEKTCLTDTPNDDHI